MRPIRCFILLLLLPLTAPEVHAACLDCHQSAMGARRAVGAEFPTTDAHAHFGAVLDDAACVVCHDQATHADGFVDLLDPDGGPDYRFAQPEDLSSDPDLSDFCAACHDLDGATRLASPLDPFGDGNPPPDVASRFAGTLQWNETYGDGCFGEEGTLRAVNSHHDISDADQAFSGAKLECLNCHGSHLSGASQTLADPWNPTQPWTLDGDTFCLSCHRGGAGPQSPGFPTSVDGPSVALRGIQSCDYTAGPWYVDHAWLHSAHGSDSKRGWEGYSGAPSAVVGCTVCHDPHGSWTPTNLEGNPYSIRDTVDGRPFVDDGVQPGGQWTGPPWTTFGVLQEDVVVGIDGVTLSWANLCQGCHANWEAANEYHAFCGGCQVCHGHGQLWGEHDWGPGTDESSPCDPVATEAGAPSSPLVKRLLSNHPNPFNPQTEIRFVLDRRAQIRLEVFDLAGRHVRTLLDGEYGPGPHQTTWNGRDSSGRELASGVYLYRLKSDGFAEARRMVLLK